MPSLRRLPFVLLDVFTSHPLEGNQLAVFTDGGGLSPQEMQRVARETNLSETTFVLPDQAAAPGTPTRVRIFTVEEELPFAGHPTLGTASVLRGTTGSPEVVLGLGVGPVPVTFEDGPEGAFGEMRQRDPVFGRRHDPAEVARALGLADGILDPALPIETVSTGLAFVMVPVRSLAALQRLRPDLARGADYLAGTDAKFFYFVCRETVDRKARLHARMLFYGGEDPATGSAAGCCAAWMVAHGVAAPGERVLIEQGLEARRPSQLFVRAARLGDAIAEVRVGGHVVEVGRGELSIPISPAELRGAGG